MTTNLGRNCIIAFLIRSSSSVKPLFISSFIAAISAAIHGHNRVCAVHLIDCITVLIHGQGGIVHRGLGNCHRILLHEGLKSRELLFHYGIDLFLQLTQGDVCVLGNICSNRADLLHDLRHLRLTDLHHANATVNCYCSCHHVHHFSVLSPGLWEGKTPKQNMSEDTAPLAGQKEKPDPRDSQSDPIRIPPAPANKSLYCWFCYGILRLL